MLITKIQLAAMERVDTPEKERKDFFLYVDEFQNFATESFSNILSEARKYRLDLTMAHQYMEQLDETVLAAVIGNVGTLVTFRVGSTDAEILAKEFAPTFIETDLVNLTKFQIYLKLMIDGVASQPFSANTLSPINISTQSTEKVIKVSRERYATSRENIEDKIMRWTGMEAGGTGDTDSDEDEDYTEDEEGMPVLIDKKAPVPAPAPVQKPTPPPTIKSTPPTPSPVKSSSPVSQNSDIKNSKPVSLVDTAQKGISLSQAVQTNKQPVKTERKPEYKPAPTNQSRPKPSQSSQPSYQKPANPPAPVAPKKIEPVAVVIPPQPNPVVNPQPAPVVPPPPASRNEPEKNLSPGKIVKIDDDQA